MSKQNTETSTENTEVGPAGSSTAPPANAGIESAPAFSGPPPLPVPAPPQLLGEAEIEDLKSKASKAQQWYDQWLRTTADLDNYKKRAARERTEAVRGANESLLVKLVPVLDNFEMAMLAAESEGTTPSPQSLKTGVAMIQQQLRAALTEAGLEEVDATGKTFDPNFHEAVAQEESTAVPEGQVLRQLRKGYKLRERLLRPATVVVSKPPQA